MKINIFSIVLLPLLSLVACVSARAQSSSTTVQDHASTHHQQQNARRGPTSLVSPLLGAPEGYDDTYSSRFGGSSPGLDNASPRRELNNAQRPPEPILSPLLGAPEGPEVADQSNLGYALGETIASSQATSDPLAPIVQLPSPKLADRRNPAAVKSALRQNAGGADVVVERNGSHNTKPVTAAQGSSATSRLDSLNRGAGIDTAIAVYKSPW